ncbi:Serine (or cysteine) peptidase inhibitor, clade B (ovalbumin), member 3A [Apodemus speciosus]|uniref:Serine (Or cysteine) peptidase inhibitor, clade B (Ovalbumin), member 3A n=1 Tax=Apodemus speciosus TaxID=105296 RepID=A0ABQ0EE29_APOSI
MHLFAEATTKFTLELYWQLRESEGNIFYSPLSIMTALGMLQLGAKGNTEQQIEKALQFNETTKKTTEKSADRHEENVHEQFQKLMTQLNKSNDAYDLKAANSIYGAKEFQFLQTFLEDIKEYYKANVESLDFAHAAEECRKKINSWVESQTNGKIKDLFPSGSLSSSTILVLVNAVYFKGQWNQQFDEKHTTEEKFWLNKNTSKPVQMMKQKNKFNFIFLEDVQAKIVEIPYKGSELSMYVLLPMEIDGLKKLEEQLTADKLLEWTSRQNMHMVELYLSLPRFKVEQKYELPGPLEHMGMVDAFSPQKADFSGMSSTPGLMVSKVLHKSFVEVNEEGTEAAAATGVEIRKYSAQITEDFCCDHAFLFFIKQCKTNTTLFFGRMSSP